MTDYLVNRQTLVGSLKVNNRPSVKLCFALFRLGISLLNSFQGYFYLLVSARCCFFSIISTLDTFRIRFKMSEGLFVLPFSRFCII